MTIGILYSRSTAHPELILDFIDGANVLKHTNMEAETLLYLFDSFPAYLFLLRKMSDKSNINNCY
jgi:hypothetical protein